MTPDPLPRPLPSPAASGEHEASPPPHPFPPMPPPLPSSTPFTHHPSSGEHEASPPPPHPPLPSCTPPLPSSTPSPSPHLQASMRPAGALRPRCSCRWRAAIPAAAAGGCCSSAQPTGPRSVIGERDDDGRVMSHKRSPVWAGNNDVFKQCPALPHNPGCWGLLAA